MDKEVHDFMKRKQKDLEEYILFTIIVNNKVLTK